METKIFTEKDTFAMNFFKYFNVKIDWKIVLFIFILIFILFLPNILKLSKSLTKSIAGDVSLFCVYFLVFNYFIFVFNLTVYLYRVYNKGKRGPKGRIGERGPLGDDEICDICSVKTKVFTKDDAIEESYFSGVKSKQNKSIQDTLSEKYLQQINKGYNHIKEDEDINNDDKLIKKKDTNNKFKFNDSDKPLVGGYFNENILSGDISNPLFVKDSNKHPNLYNGKAEKSEIIETFKGGGSPPPPPPPPNPYVSDWWSHNRYITRGNAMKQHNQNVKNWFVNFDNNISNDSSARNQYNRDIQEEKNRKYRLVENFNSYLYNKIDYQLRKENLLKEDRDLGDEVLLKDKVDFDSNFICPRRSAIYKMDSLHKYENKDTKLKGLKFYCRDIETGHNKLVKDNFGNLNNYAYFGIEPKKDIGGGVDEENYKFDSIECKPIVKPGSSKREMTQSFLSKPSYDFKTKKLDFHDCIYYGDNKK